MQDDAVALHARACFSRVGVLERQPVCVCERRAGGNISSLHLIEPALAGQGRFASANKRSDILFSPLGFWTRSKPNSAFKVVERHRDESSNQRAQK